MKSFQAHLLFFAVIIISTLSAFSSSAANSPFSPLIINYTTHNYKAGNQNWTVAQGDNDIIYIGNDYGLLSYDASNWKMHPLPNNLSVKSILVDSSTGEERIYVGSFEEFGYFTRNRNKDLDYHSLTHLIKDYSLYNDEVWTINKSGSMVFFQTFSSYFIFDEKENSVTTHTPFPAPLYFFNVHNTIYAQFIDSDFNYFDGKSFQPLLSREQLGDDNVISAIPLNEDVLLITSKKGIFRYSPEKKNVTKFHTTADSQLNKETANRAIGLNDSTFVVGTLNDGIYALNKSGSLLWHINQTNGLYNNTILGLYKDHNNNLWAALDNGVAYIRTNSKLKVYIPPKVHIGMVEDILLKNNNIYIASNQGVYLYSWKDDTLNPVDGINMQTWFIRNFDNQIISGNNAGTLFIEGNRKIDIPDASTGGTDIKQVKINNIDILLESTYTALQVYMKNKNGKWEYRHKVGNFFDLIYQIEQDHSGNIWASHMYRGIYKLRLNERLTDVESRQFYQRLDSITNGVKPIRVMKLRGRVVFTNGSKFYTYNDMEQEITEFRILNEELHGLADTRDIVTINDTLFWFLRPREYTLVTYTKSKYSIADNIPFSTLTNSPNTGRGNIIADGHTSYFGLNGGVGRYEHNLSTKHSTPELKVLKMWSRNRKTTEAEIVDMQETNELRYSNNSVTVEFQYPDFSQKTIKILCFLQNYDSQWLETSENRTIEYSNLPAGNYVLDCKAIDDAGSTLSEISISFRIKKPWYKTNVALLIYILTTLLITHCGIKIYINTTLNNKRKLFEQQEKERLSKIEKHEKTIALLKAEKLEDELIFKSKELANASLMLINQEKILNTLKNEISTYIFSNKIPKTQGNTLIRMIDMNILGEDEWRVFQENFDLIHKNFFHKLTETYPSLTSSDLRMCALLRLNYSSKEIAQMLNLSPRGVEAARYRLRKKLNLNEEENLNTHIINFK